MSKLYGCKNNAHLISCWLGFCRDLKKVSGLWSVNTIKRRYTRSNIDIKMLQHPSKCQSLFFNNWIVILMLVKLSREVTYRAVYSIHIFLQQDSTSTRVASIDVQFKRSRRGSANTGAEHSNACTLSKASWQREDQVYLALAFNKSVSGATTDEKSLQKQR